MAFMSFISLVVFCLVALSTSERGALKSSTVIVVLFISVFSFVSFRFIYFEALLFVHTHFRPVMSSWRTEPFIVIECPCRWQFSLLSSPPYPILILLINVSFDQCLHGISFLSFYFQPTQVIKFEVNFLQIGYSQVVFCFVLNPLCQSLSFDQSMQIICD